MEQFLLRLPETLAAKVHEMIRSESLTGICYESTGELDGRDFIFKVGAEKYAGTLVNLATVIETHKTFDHSAYFKSGDVGQILLIHETEEDKIKFRESKHVDKDGNFMHGITPPTKNIVKRRFEKMYKQGRPGMFRPDEVRKVEGELHRLTQKGENGKLTKDVFEELVEFEEYMVDTDHPNGITVTHDSPLVKQYPEILMRGEQRRKYEDERTRKYEEGEQAKLKAALSKSQRRQKKASQPSGGRGGASVKVKLGGSGSGTSRHTQRAAATAVDNSGVDEDDEQGDSAWAQLDMEVEGELAGDDDMDSDDDDEAGGGRTSASAYQQLKVELSKLTREKQNAEQERATFQKQLDKAANSFVKKIQKEKVDEKQATIDRLNSEIKKVQAQING